MREGAMLGKRMRSSASAVSTVLEWIDLLLEWPQLNTLQN